MNRTRTRTQKLKLAAGAVLFAVAATVQPADAALPESHVEHCDEVRVGMILPPMHRPIYEDEVPYTIFINVNNSRYPEQLALMAFELNAAGDVELTYSGSVCR